MCCSNSLRVELWWRVVSGLQPASQRRRIFIGDPILVIRRMAIFFANSWLICGLAPWTRTILTPRLWVRQYHNNVTKSFYRQRLRLSIITMVLPREHSRKGLIVWNLLLALYFLISQNKSICVYLFVNLAFEFKIKQHIFGIKRKLLFSSRVHYINCLSVECA